MTWQPISTAPKDRWILAAEYQPPDPFPAVYAARWSRDGYWMSNCGQPVVQTPEPTHWAPLDEPLQ